MPNKSGPTSTLNPNGPPRRGFSLLSTPAALYALLRKRSWLRTTAQLLVVGIVAFGGVGIIRAPHTKLPAAIAQDPGGSTEPLIPASDAQDLDAATEVAFPDPDPSAPGDAQPGTSMPFLSTDPNYASAKAALDSDTTVYPPRPDQTGTTAPPSPSSGSSNAATSGGSSSGISIDTPITNITKMNSFDYDFSASSATHQYVYTPSDAHGVMGKTHYIAVVNSHIWIYKRVASPGSTLLNNLVLVSHTPMDLFMHYTPAYVDSKGVPFNTKGTPDAKVIYDRVNNRFIVVCISRNFDRPGVHYLHMAVSKPSDLNGNTTPFVNTGTRTLVPYYVYHWNMARNVGDFWDQPGLGQDQNAVIVTGNIFGNFSFATDFGSYQGSGMFSIPKSLLYVGAAPTQVSFFRGLAPSLEPPNVLDQNANSYLISAYEAASGITSAVGVYRLTNTTSVSPTLHGITKVSVPGFSAPRTARQEPATLTYHLETQDGRFTNASTQVGSSLFQIHCVNNSGRPGVTYYEINTANYTLSHYGTYYYTPNSDDFNASCAADDNGNVYFSWNVTDPIKTNGVPMILSTYHVPANSSGNIAYTGAYALVSLPSPTDDEETDSSGVNVLRWGDYCATCIDPLYSGRAWCANQYQVTPGEWGVALYSFTKN